MGSPLSPVITKLVMEDLQQRGLTIFPNPLSIWVYYIDDVYAIMETKHIEPFHLYLSLINSLIQFTKEIEASGSRSFLDVLLRRGADGSFSTNRVATSWKSPGKSWIFLLSWKVLESP